MTENEQKEIEEFLALFNEDDMPYPDHDRMKFGAMRVHVYRGEATYAVLYEMVMFSEEDLRILKMHGFSNFLFLYTKSENGLEKSGWNDDTPMTITRPPDEPSLAVTAHTDEFIEDVRSRERLNPAASSILVRGKRVEVPHDPSAYLAEEIPVEDPIQLISVLRWLLKNHRDEIFLLEEERNELLQNMNHVLTLDEWNHFDFSGVQNFYESQAVKMLAAVAVTGDASLYCPTEEPNTHWSKR